MKKSEVITFCEEQVGACDRTLLALRTRVRHPDARGRGRAIVEAAVGLPLIGFMAALADVLPAIVRRTPAAMRDPE